MPSFERPSDETGSGIAIRALARSIGAPAVNLQAEVERQLLALAVPLYAADRSGMLLFANEGYRSLLKGRKPGAEAAEDEARLLSPEALVLVEREQGPVVLEHVLAFGEKVRHFRSRHFPLTEDGGRQIGVGGVYLEVSHEVRLAERAERASERFDDIARLVSDWMWEVDKTFNFTYVSARVLEVFGMHPRLLLGSNLFELGNFAGPGGASLDASVRTPFRDQPFHVIGPDGRTRICLMSGMPVFDAAGSFVGYRGTGTDVTARIEAEQQARSAQLQLAEAIEASSEAFALFDRANRLVICNGKFHEYHAPIADILVPGITYEEFVSKGAERGLFADAAGCIDAWVARELDNLRNPRGPYEQRLKDGRWLKVSDRRAGDGSLVCLRTDITDLKHREEALRNAEESSRTARESAELANRAKSEFLANVSHELRTPLNAIIGFSEIIMAEMFGPIDSPQYKEYIKDIHDSGTHLYNLINDILDVSKAEAGKLELSEAVVDVADAVARCVRLVKDRAARAEVRLEVKTPDDLSRLFADERKIKQILLNLLSNAVKFTPAGGTVTTTVGLTPEGDFAITVADSGIGIAPEDLATVMAPFGQVDSRLARKYEGTGLGLPLTKALVELHGGSLSLESEVHKGTTVTALFPADRVRAVGGAVISD